MNVCQMAVAALLAGSAVAQVPVITGFDHDGRITWTNSTQYSSTIIQVCPNLGFDESTNWHDMAITRNRSSALLALGGTGEFYRVSATDAPVTIRHKLIAQQLGGTNEPTLYDLDLDEDGLFDLTFRCQGYGSATPGYTVECAAWRYDSDLIHHGNDYLSPTRLSAQPLPEGAVISGGTDGWWETLATLSCAGPPAFTNIAGGYPWFGVTNAYMPVTLVSSSGTHYAWIRMDITTGSYPFGEFTNFPWLTWSIHDAAFETVAGRGIVAGQTE